MADLSDLRIDRPTPSARQSNPWRSAFIALVIVAALGAAGAYVAFTPSLKERERVTEPARPANADVTSNALPPPPTTFTAAGYVEVVPPGARIVSSIIPGMVKEIHVLEGQPVREGELVATLETALLERERFVREAEVGVLLARLARLEAGFLPEEILQAEARVDAARGRLDAAEKYLAALTQVADTEGSLAGAAPLRVVLETQAEAIHAAAALAEAEAGLQIKRRGARPEDLAIARAELARAQIDLEQVQWKVERCAITAPMDGVVFQQLAQPGQWIGGESSDRGKGGAAVASIFDPSSLQAWVDVNQRDLPRIRIGQRVTMTADASARPGETIEGRVIQFMPRASIERNTVRIKISIEGEHAYLRPDMSLRVTFHE